MSSTSSSVAATGPIFLPLFTAAQWRELEHQALIYKYLVAGLPVPPDLVFPIRRSFESVSSTFFHHPSLGYSSYYGKKFDPEPGRCRRTDGKKWRCTKDAYPDSKYCERHMNRGRNRSRKHVESQSTSQSSSTVISHTTTGSSGGSGSFQNLPLHPIVDFEGSFFGNSISKLPMEPVPYGINDKEYRYLHGLKPEANARNFSPEASASGRGLKIESNVDSTWHLMPAQVPLDPFLKLRHGTHLQNDTPQLHTPQDFEPMIDAVMSKQRQQHCFFGSDLDSPRPVQHEHHPMRPFFDEWPNARDSWSNLDEQRSNKSAFSTTQLSMSIPMTPSEFSTRSACSPNGESPYNA